MREHVTLYLRGFDHLLVHYSFTKAVWDCFMNLFGVDLGKILGVTCEIQKKEKRKRASLIIFGVLCDTDTSHPLLILVYDPYHIRLR